MNRKDNPTKGKRNERFLAKKLRNRGYIVKDSSGSYGKPDLEVFHTVPKGFRKKGGTLKEVSKLKHSYAIEVKELNLSKSKTIQFNKKSWDRLKNYAKERDMRIRVLFIFRKKGTKPIIIGTTKAFIDSKAKENIEHIGISFLQLIREKLDIFYNGVMF